jgi:manganese oxidase
MSSAAVDDRRRSRLPRPVALAALGVATLLVAAAQPSQPHGPRRGQIRTYYIAADKVRWDYAPAGRNLITGKPFDETANVFVKRGPGRIGRVYLKARYRQYTDGSFTSRTPVPPAWRHLGVLGPVIHAEVGDTVKVVFKNNLDRPATLHPHGLAYTKQSEGAPYNDATTGRDKADDAVRPGHVFTYTWQVPERAGPGPMDPSSILWMYHSHVDEPRDTNSGLIGPIVVTRRGMARADGTPANIDREFVTLFSVLDENQSWYLEENARRFAGGPPPPEGDPDLEAFQESNLMHSINGFVYGNLPGLTMRSGERARWYLMGMGTEVDLHTPHWHGQTVVLNGMRTDVANLLPATMQVADMTPDLPATWLYHCHVNDHIVAGMQALFEVHPSQSTAAS